MLAEVSAWVFGFANVEITILYNLQGVEKNIFFYISNIEIIILSGKMTELVNLYL